MRKIARTDVNQQEIVSALRQMGCSVVSLAPLGNGIPDLLCGYQGVTFLCEIKDGNMPPSKQALTEDQKEFFQSWRGGILTIVHSVSDAVELLQSLNKKARVQVLT